MERIFIANIDSDAPARIAARRKRETDLSHVLNIAFDLATEIDACRDIAEMRRILAEIAGQAGADAIVLRERLAGSDETMTAHVVAELGARRWFEADLATGFLTVTPLRAYMLRERRPLDLAMLRRLCAAAGVTEVMEAFLDLARINDYAITPLLGAGKTVGSLSVASETGRLAPDALLLITLIAPAMRAAVARLREDAPPPPKNRLTERELEVLRWCSHGRTSHEIAGLLGITERTANAHVMNAIGKMKVASRAQAVAEALRLGLID